MDDNGWAKTRRGRVSYKRPLHPFTFRDARRIISNLIIDDQLDMGQRKALSSALYPAEDYLDVPKDKISIFAEIREFLLEKLLPNMELAVPFVTWLADLEVGAIRDALKKWASSIK